MKIYSLIVLIGVQLISFSACKKSIEDFHTKDLNDYYPLEIGKYITYKLDSTIFINFGTSSIVHSYQVKYETDALITDNLGRPAYRIIRYIRNIDTDPWKSDATFMAINTGSSLEFIENNFRYLKLKQPLRDKYSWKGNSYIDTYSLNNEFKYLDDWDYVYENVGLPEQIGNFSLANCLTVNQRDESHGDITNPNTVYSEVNYSQEKYALGIGLVYRKFFHSEYQSPGGQNGYFVTGSYGVTYTMIDHN